jgi:hypothetical protein
LRAVNIVLGETWPSRPFSDKDYFNHDLTRLIVIQVFFGDPLQCDPEVYGFGLRCEAHQSPEFFALDRHGDTCRHGRGGWLSKTREQRDARRSRLAIPGVGPRSGSLSALLKALPNMPPGMYINFIRGRKRSSGGGLRRHFGPVVAVKTKYDPKQTRLNQNIQPLIVA